MAEVVAHDFDDLGLSQSVANAPARHGIGLRDAVDEDGALLYLFAQAGHGGEFQPIIEQAGVDLVGDDVQVVLHAHIHQSLQLLPIVHHAGGVGGIVENHGLGLGGNGIPQLLSGDFKPGRLLRSHHHRHAAHHADQLNVADPVGGRDNHLIPGIDQSPESHIHTVLGTGGHHHLGRLILHVEVRLHTLAHRLLNAGQTGSGGVAGVILLNGPDTSGLDLVWGVKIRLTSAKSHHVNAVGLHLLGQRVNGHGAGCLHLRGNLGQFFQVNPSVHFICDILYRLSCIYARVNPTDTGYFACYSVLCCKIHRVRLVVFLR